MSSNFRLPEPSGLGGDEKFLAVETIFIYLFLFFFSRICDICRNAKSAILFVFTNFSPNKWLNRLR